MADALLLPYLPPILAGKGGKVLSGTILSDGSPAVARQVLIYWNKAVDVTHETVTDSSGNFSQTVLGNENDKYRVVVVGEDGEYSKIFEDVSPG